MSADLLRWVGFERAVPPLAAVGRRKLHHADHGVVALLATVDPAGRPALAPVCPILAGWGVYVLAARATPKVAHLRAHGGYALHAQVGADDEEFRISGRAVEAPERDRDAVLAAVPFPVFDPRDPIFELLIERAIAVTWPRPGEREVSGFRVSPAR